jgi:hypothetical protein
MRAAEAPHADDHAAARFLLFTDTALKGQCFASFGGWLHGLFFTMHIPDDFLGYPIAQLEFLAVIYVILIFAKALKGT